MPLFGRLRPVQLGSSKRVRVGQKAYCIGNPRGLDHTFSAGIVSALDREVEGYITCNMIQTDAAMNPGNSGGPLLSSNHKVIGVNAMIATNSGGSEVHFFADHVPLSLVCWLVLVLGLFAPVDTKAVIFIPVVCLVVLTTMLGHRVCHPNRHGQGHRRTDHQARGSQAALPGPRAGPGHHAAADRG